MPQPAGLEPAGAAALGAPGSGLDAWSAAADGVPDADSNPAVSIPAPEIGIVVLHADDPCYKRALAKISGASAIVRPMLDVPFSEFASLDFGRRVKKQMLNIWRMTGIVGALIARFCFESFLHIPEKPAGISDHRYTWLVKVHASLVIISMTSLAVCVLMSGIWHGFFSTVPETNIVRAVHFFEHFVMIPVILLVVGALFFLLDLVCLGEIVYADYAEPVWISRAVGLCTALFSIVVLTVILFVFNVKMQDMMRSRGDDVQLPSALRKLLEAEHHQQQKQQQPNFDAAYRDVAGYLQRTRARRRPMHMRAGRADPDNMSTPLAAADLETAYPASRSPAEYLQRPVMWSASATEFGESKV